MNFDPKAKIISQEFKRAGLSLSSKELECFVILDFNLNRYNEELDLTRIDDPSSIIVKHYVDSAKAAEYITPVDGILMDLGSGAGFPGLPIAILRPDLKLLLAEPRNRRLSFMEDMVNQLKLTNVEFYPHKVGPRFDREINSIITRDFQPLGDTLILASQILPQGGHVFLMKGPGVNKELEEAKKLYQWSEFEALDDFSYSLGAQNIQHRLLSFRKKTSPNIVSKPSNIFKNPIIEIASNVNVRYKSWVKLQEGRHIKKFGQALASGQKIVKDILFNHPEKVQGILARRLDDLDYLPSFDSNIKIYLIRSEIFPNLDISGTGGPLLLIAAPEAPPWDPSNNFTGLRLFLPLQDPANLGTVIRSAAAMGAEIVLLEESAHPFHPKALRAAGPAIYQVKIWKGPTLKELASLNLDPIMALSPRGENIHDFIVPPSLGLVIGLEGPGLDSLWPLKKRLSIPMKAGVESLNASAAAAMAMIILTNKF